MTDAYRIAVIAEMYQRGATQAEIADAIGMDQTSVSRLMRKHGIQRRPARFTKTHGMEGTAEYRAWQQMKNRCLNPRFTSYPRYGGRGVQVCKRWLLSFENFLADMGPRPSAKHSLDRYPKRDGNYEPGNCRWATRDEQQQNRDDNVLTPTLVRQIRRSQESASAIARRLGVSVSAVWDARTRRSWRNV